MKFEEFYFDTNEEIYSVEELLNIYNQDKNTFKKIYYNHMYCPECCKAELSFHPNANTPHLRTKHSSHHEPSCSCNYESANKRQLDEYYNDSKNFESINRKLKACIDLLIKPPEGSSINSNPKNITNIKNEEDKFTFDSSGKRVSIRRKKITVALDETKDYGLPILFYGCVIVKWNLKYEVSNVRYIQLKNVENNKLLCSIKVTQSVYENLDDEIKLIDDQICNVAFMAEMTRYQKFNNCILKHSSLIIIETKQ